MGKEYGIFRKTIFNWLKNIETLTPLKILIIIAEKKKFKEELIPYIGVCALFTGFSPLMQYIEEEYLATSNLVLTIISLILDLITFLIVKNVIKTKNKELNEVLPILLLIVAAVLGFIVMYLILNTYE